ncbi:MAG: 50S ribosomal protein L21 [Enterobacteriaceae bacterium PSpyr]|nr:MAG: 50S ribosomal protein L21 [Enterobacteriaceae bacterium PSpyr]
MYAIITDSSKQYKIKENQILKIEKKKKKIGEKIIFKKILLFIKNKVIKIGHPYIKNIMVEAKILNHSKSKKIKIIKFKRRKNQRKKIGHRQNYTNIKIIKIIN